MLPKILDHALQYDIRPNKTLGQNFILDINFCQKIISHENIVGKNILEIGPGLGSLTRAILSKNPSNLLCLEKDSKCIQILRDIQKHYPKLEFHEVDALNFIKKIKVDTIKSDKFDLIKFNIDSVISNLPYNVGNRIIIDLIELICLGAQIKSMTFMVQKEVADRILAEPNCKEYGQLTVLINSVCDVTRIMNVGPQIFYPPPKIESSVLHFTPRSNNKYQITLKFFETIKTLTCASFNQRRKIIKTSMKNFLPFIPVEFWSKRAENLTIENYIDIAASIIHSSPII